ncbi:MAG: Uma2 family endonuclease [Anaerolineae bacterium]|nr:Uma2 family endonuclease [Anaerolineae bacterium]
MSTQTAVATPTKLPPQVSPKLITGEELYAMGDIGPSELVKGEIKYLMPTGHPHGYIENIIGALLYIYSKTHPIGRALSGEVGIYTRRNPDTVRAADVAFISHKRLAQAQTEGYLNVAPELVVEIMSPTNTWSEVQKKLAEYFAVGVLMVWVVDPQLEQIHVYRSPEQMKLLRKEDRLVGDDVLPGFQVELTEIFTAE